MNKHIPEALIPFLADFLNNKISTENHKLLRQLVEDELRGRDYPLYSDNAKSLADWVQEVFGKFYQAQCSRTRNGQPIEALWAYFFEVIKSVRNEMLSGGDTALYKKTQNILSKSNFFIRINSGERAKFNWKNERWTLCEWKGQGVSNAQDEVFLSYQGRACSFEEGVKFFDKNRRVNSTPTHILTDEVVIYFQAVYYDMEKLFGKQFALLAAQLTKLLKQKFWMIFQKPVSLSSMESNTRERAEEKLPVGGVLNEEEYFGIDREFFLEKNIGRLLNDIMSGALGFIKDEHLWLKLVQANLEEKISHQELEEMLKAFVPPLEQYSHSSLWKMEKQINAIFVKYDIGYDGQHSINALSSAFATYFERKYSKSINIREKLREIQKFREVQKRKEIQAKKQRGESKK